jgi:hypothetical protein
MRTLVGRYIYGIAEGREVDLIGEGGRISLVPVVIASILTAGPVSTNKQNSVIILNKPGRIVSS